MSNSNIVELHVQRTDTDETLKLKGREAWTLTSLIEAGERGLTPLDRPAPRWSGYVYALRKRGLAIETVDERHSGPYPGAHGRYILRTPLTVLKTVCAEDKRRRGLSDVVRAAYAQIVGQAPNGVS
jgi:hypothetical protein